MKIVYCYAVPEETHALFRGPVSGWFRDRCIPAYRSNIENGWWLRQERLDDVLPRMESSGLSVRFSAGRAPRYVPPVAVVPVKAA